MLGLGLALYLDKVPIGTDCCSLLILPFLSGTGSERVCSHTTPLSVRYLVSTKAMCISVFLNIRVHFSSSAVPATSLRHTVCLYLSF